MKSRSSRRTRPAPSRRPRPLLETLERRQLLSAVSVVRHGLNVEGTTGDDVIIVSRAASLPNTLSVSINGRLTGVDELGLRRINISGLEGNDVLLVDDTFGAINLPANIAGGSGNDTIGGASGADVLQGGKGDDLIRGGDAGDVLEGHAGNDTLFGGAGRDNLDGGAGADLLATGGERREVLITDAGDTVDRTLPHFDHAPITKNNAKPNFFNATPVGLTPQQVRAAYGIDSLGLTGAGQTIAIVDAYDAPTVRRDLQTFSEQFGLPDVTKDNFQVYYATKQRPNYDAGWSTETSLDVQWARAIAPDAKIILVEARSASDADIYQAIDRAVELLQPTGGVLSLSLGRNEFYYDPLGASHFNNPSTQNVTFSNASGDFGAQASFPTAFPEVTAVGGTYLNLDASGNLLTPEEGWTGSGGGLSSFFPQPDFQAGVTLAGGNLGNRRAMPDIAMLADPRSGTAVFNSSPDIIGFSGWQSVGGTSLAAPMFAGVTALVNERRAQLGKGVIGNLMNPALYAAAQDDYAGNFNDIITGTNGYSATRGYDLVTGLGSPKPALVESLANYSTPRGAGANVAFEQAQLRLQPGKLTLFGGTGFATQNGNLWDLRLLPSSRSGVSMALDGPLTPTGDGLLATTGTIEVITGPKTTVSYLIKVVARETDDGGLAGEFYAVSKRGKILYQGDRPLLYGTFTAV